MTTWFAEHALLPDGPARDVRLEVGDGRFTAVTADATPDGATRLPGVVLPGLANGHSHAFHRALRGRTHASGGSFWTWRQQMYELAATLDPEGYLALARAVYAEMALSGVTSVGEFHYLHHAPDGRPYADPNEMAHALRQAAADAGVRLTLLDACYLSGGLTAEGHRPLADVQPRFADRDVDTWVERVSALHAVDGFRVGVAVHSIRAVPREFLPTVVDAAAGRPLHVHLSEQPAENEASAGFYGATPTELLADAGAWGGASTAVHATHLTGSDIATLGAATATVCMCPTTERDLADGVGPASELAAAGARIGLGTDQHAVVDLFEEARGLELDERLVSGGRGRFTPAALLDALTAHDGLGWHDTGVLAVGARADLVAVRLDSVRTAGVRPEQVMFAATATDVDTVLRDGRAVVRDGVHVLGDVGALLARAIGAAWQR